MTRPSTRSIGACLASLLLMLQAGPALAQAEATATLGDLRFSFVDLDPHDDSAPSLVWADSARSSASVTAFTLTERDPLQPTQSSGSTGRPLRAQFGALGTAHSFGAVWSSAAGASATGLAWTPSGTQGSHWSAFGATAMPATGIFELSPATELTIDVDILLDAKVSPLLADPQRWEVAGAHYRVSLALLSPDNQVVEMESSELQIWADTRKGTTSDHLAMPVSLTVSNPTGSWMRGHAVLTADALAASFAQPVPEISTQASLLAGLAGLGALLRGRKRRASQLAAKKRSTSA